MLLYTRVHVNELLIFIHNVLSAYQRFFGGCTDDVGDHSILFTADEYSDLGGIMAGMTGLALSYAFLPRRDSVV
jgi:hypothetical protein